MMTADTYCEKAPVPKSNIEYEWSNFNVSLIMDDPFIQGWTDESNDAWRDFSEGGNSEYIGDGPNCSTKEEKDN